MKLAELVIQLSANTASLKKDFEQAKSQAAEFASSMKSALAGIGVGIGVGGLVEAIKQVTEYEDKIGLAAKATGMTAEQMSSLTYAAKQFEVPLHDLTMGLAYFDRVEGGLMRSKQGQTAMRILGLSVRDLNGHLKMSHQMLMEVADKFSHLKDSTEKTAIATALFGQTYGLELIPFLDQGSKGIKELEERAKQLGITLDENDVDAAVKAEAAFHDLESRLLGVGVVASRTLIPPLMEIMEVLAGDGNALRAFGEGLEITATEWAKLATYLTPATAIFGGGLRKKLQAEITNLETERELNLQSMSSKLPDFDAMFKQSKIDIPANALGKIGHAKSGIDKVSESIAHLKDELIGLTQGDAERSIQHLREIGASPAQISQANAILNQIAATKQQQAAIRQLAEANRDYDNMVDSLSDSIIHLDQAQKDYIKTVAQLNLLESQGVNITEGLALAREKYRQDLLGEFKTPAEMGLKNESKNVDGDIFAGGLATPGAPTLTIMEKMQPLAKNLGKTLSGAFEGMVISGKGFNQMLLRMTTLFAEFLMKAIVFKELANVFGAATGNSGGQSQSGGATGGKGGGIGSVLGSLFSGLAGSLAGGRASGGPVTSGQLYMVGENGPELFAPGMSGSIIPNGGSAQRSSSTNVNIDARGADAGVEQRIYRAMQVMQKQNVGQSLVVNYEYQARGGTL